MAGKLDIAVVGAGPAGLAAALYLSRAGHRVTIFERFPQAAPVGSGLILQPTGLSVLHELGLAGAMVRLGARIERLHGADARSGRTVLDVRYDAAKGGRFGVAVQRTALFDLLFEAVRAAGLPVETGHAAAELDADGLKAALVFAGGRRRAGFDLVVDASGRGSTLRRAAMRPAEPRPFPFGAFWASVPWRDEGFDAHALLQRYRRASVMIGVLPVGRAAPGAPRLAALFWSLKPADLERVQADGLDAWKRRLLDLWPECAPLVAGIGRFDQLTLARYGHHTLVPPAGRRLAVIGDAAHSTSPQLGQGANMALLDAAALARVLEGAEDVASALERYARMRMRHVRLFQALSWMFTPFYQSDSAMLPILRDRLVASAARVPPAARLLAATVMGTLIAPLRDAALPEPDWLALRRSTEDA